MGIKAKEYIAKLQVIGKKIQVARKKKDLTQKDLAEKLGITRVYMGYIEQGRESPSLYLMFRLSDVLNIPLDKLVNNTR